MAPEEPLKSAKTSQDELAVISNRLAIAMAKREALVKSWTSSASSTQSEKTQEELDAEDAAMFPNEPAYLGVGAAIPAHFLANESERGNKALRAKMFATKGLKASKARDAEEKAASAKRRMIEESSEEEGGRSSLGRAKKLKGRPNTALVPTPQREEEVESESDQETKHQVKAKKRKVEEKTNGQAEPVGKASSGNKKVEKVNKALLSMANKVQGPVADLDKEAENGNPVQPVLTEPKLAKAEVPKPVAGLSGIEESGAASLKKDDGMDAAERRKLKKKLKKKMKKLREAELDDKA